MKKFLLTIPLLLLCSCWGGLSRTEVIKHPDSSMQIMECKDDLFGNVLVKVAVYSKIKNKMIVKGWVRLDALQYWTITKYDWEKKIKERGN